MVARASSTNDANSTVAAKFVEIVRKPEGFQGHTSPAPHPSLPMPERQMPIDPFTGKCEWAESSFLDPANYYFYYYYYYYYYYI